MENNESNIYQAPESDVNLEVETQSKQYRGPVARPAGEGLSWIGDGWSLFKQSPGPWVITMIVGFLIVIVLNFIPLIGQLAMWLTLFVWMGGLMLGCKAQTEGQPFDIKFLFEGFKHRVGSLIGLSVLLSLLSIAIMMVFVGGAYLDILAGDQSAMEGDPIGIVLKMLLAMALMIPLYMAVWFAPALIVLQDMPIFDAMKASFFGCLKNVLPFLLYGIVMTVLYILALLPLLLGLLVLVPVFYCSIFRSYEKIYLSE